MYGRYKIDRYICAFCILHATCVISRHVESWRFPTKDLVIETTRRFLGAVVCLKECRQSQSVICKKHLRLALQCNSGAVSAKKFKRDRPIFGPCPFAQHGSVNHVLAVLLAQHVPILFPAHHTHYVLQLPTCNDKCEKSSCFCLLHLLLPCAVHIKTSILGTLEPPPNEIVGAKRHRFFENSFVL